MSNKVMNQTKIKLVENEKNEKSPVKTLKNSVQRHCQYLKILHCKPEIGINM